MLRLRLLILLAGGAAIYYFSWLLSLGRADAIVLFAILVVAELFNMVQAIGYWVTVWKQKWPDWESADFEDTRESVDIYITVCGEPEWIVERTISAAKDVSHPRKNIYILDDTQDDRMQPMADRLGVIRITRPDRIHAKAGNVNHALGVTDGDFIVILDADHAPAETFLERTLGAFVHHRTAIVQTPQVYVNTESNSVAAAAHEQQALFYEPILRGKYGHGAVFSCGTNVIFRRTALNEIGGLATDSITEDLSTSMELQQRGWDAAYCPEVLAEGLGPEDISSYSGQQMRWARGSLPVLLKKGIFGRGLTISQRVQYFFSFIYWFTGLSYLLYLTVLLGGLFTGERPFVGILEYPAHFLPYFILTMMTLGYSARGRFSFAAVRITLCTFWVHLRAILSVLIGERLGFVVTPKQASGRSQLRLAAPHMVLFALLCAGITYSLVAMNTPSGVSNVALAVGHLAILGGYIRMSHNPARDDGAPEKLFDDIEPIQEEIPEEVTV